MSVNSPTDVLMTIAHSLVASQKYASVEQALQGIALSEVKRKIAYYRRRIRAMERKHGADFEAFSARLKGRASPAEEDDWLAWRSAQRMLADWQRTYKELDSDRARA